MKKTDKEISQLFSEARRIASTCLATLPGLPDRAEVSALACALLAGGLVTGGKSSSNVNRAGADADQNEMMDAAYSGLDRNQPADGNF